MKIEDALVLDSYESKLIKSESIFSKLWYFLKLIMYGALVSFVLSLLLVFLTNNRFFVNCLPRFNLIVQHKYIDGCLNDGLYGSVRACNEYFRCENGIPQPQSCSYGEEWSSLNNTCVERSKSDCSKMFFCPKNFGRFKNELHCDTFYSCFFNQPYLIYCPPPLLFSSKSNDCEWPEDSDCPPPKPTTKKTKIEKLTTTTEKPYNCPQPNGFFPDPTDCTSYFLCEDNVGSRFYCAPGKGFNSKYLSCNKPEDSDCSKK